MSKATGWNLALSDRTNYVVRPGSLKSHLLSQVWLGLCDMRNVPWYVVKYAAFLMAILGTLQLWAAKGDGPMPAFAPLSLSPDFDPHRVSSSHCVLRNTGDQDRWDGLGPALAILKDTNPEVARWVECIRNDDRLEFTDCRKNDGEAVSFLAKFDLFERKLRISPGLFAEPDGSIAAVLCHEYRHSRQSFPKVFNYALSFLFCKGGNPSIVENDALIYEQEARCAIYRTNDEALEAHCARLAAR